MKSIMLMKQRMLYAEEKEDPEFLKLKDEVVGLKVPLTKSAEMIKVWIDAVRSIIKSTMELSQASTLSSVADNDLTKLGGDMQTSFDNTKTGTGLAEVALDSINRKISYIGELAIKSENLATLHLELARAIRKELHTEQERLQTEYNLLKTELLNAFAFIHKEVEQGILKEELQAFKLAQKGFYSAGASATSSFSVSAQDDAANIWTRFLQRSVGANQIDNTAKLGKSGRNLFQQGMAANSTPLTKAGSASVPPPPPPPPPAPTATAAKFTHKADYAYSAAGSDELSFAEGAKFKFISSNDPNWWNMEDESGTRGVVPANYLRKL